MPRQLVAACVCLALTAGRVAASPLSAPPEVVAQALGTLPTSSSAGWSCQLSRSLLGTGFHSELSYTLELQPCGSGSSIIGVWQRMATALRLPHQLGRCSAVAAGAVCDVALVQPLPAAMYADVDQLRNLVTSRQGSPAAFAFRLFGIADAERTEVECAAAALLLRWAAPAAQRQPSAQWVRDTAGQAVSDAALWSVSRPGFSIVTQRAIPVHARYPAPVVRGNDGSNASWWLADWKSPVVSTMLPWPQIRVRCRSEVSTDAAWHPVRLMPSAGDADRMAWGIPAGDLRHAVFVNIVTAIAYLTGAACVLGAVFRSYVVYE